LNRAAEVIASITTSTSGKPNRSFMPVAAATMIRRSSTTALGSVRRGQLLRQTNGIRPASIGTTSSAGLNAATFSRATASMRRRT
jgi:hypothetical protein